jgi:putative transposase
MLNATSVQQMFRRLKQGERPGFPRFKSDQRFKSIEYRYGDGCKPRPKENGQVCFYLQNIGELKAIYHRPIPEDAVRKHVVVKRVNSKWYVCLMLELPDPQPKPVPTGKAIGIDMGLQSLLATSAATTGISSHVLWQTLMR